MTEQICIVYCAEDKQYLKYIDFEPNLTITHAIEKSNLANEVELPQPLQCGIFGLKIKSPEEYILQIGDRIEIYRPLKMNPKDIRRQRAEKHPVGRVLKGNQWRKKSQTENKND